jgi:erythromycin esterase-like protein
MERFPGGDKTLIGQIGQHAFPLEHGRDLDPLMEMIGDGRYVLLGEASHGTSEFYLWRMRISRRLISEKGFSFIAVEGDWPDCYQVNRFAKGYGETRSAPEALRTFDRWPTWMWANWEIASLAEWLREFNEGRKVKAGFFGLDVYSLFESMRSIIGYLQEEDPEAVKLAKQAYRCFEPYGEDPQAYAWSTRMVPEDCETPVVELLKEMHRKAPSYDTDQEAPFSAEQNALVMVNAERYYRAMVRSDANSWNVRDYHMADTLDRLMAFHGPEAKAIVWAHNTHVGDARYTDMVRSGTINIGQVVRERHEKDGVVLVGFGSHRGTVIAGREWEAPMETMRVPEAKAGSWEDVLHRAGPTNRLLTLRDARQSAAFAAARGHRAIGVVYHPEYESLGNYVPTVLPHRYDAFLYIDETEALHPLRGIGPALARPPETYPWGV